MKQLSALITQYQQNIFYLFLILLLISGAMLPALAQNSTGAYKVFVDQATTALDNGDTRAAYVAFAKARKAARKDNNKEQQEAFRECLNKIPIYEAYFPLITSAETKLGEEDYKNGQSGLLAALEQLNLSMEIASDVPAFIQYEENKRLALENRIAEVEAQRLPLIEQAITSGDDKFLQNRLGEALEDFYYARSLALDQAYETRKYRVGERIQKAELHYDIYTQINLGRREAGYRRYREAQVIFQDAQAKVEKSREYYFPRLEVFDNKKHQEVEGLIDGINTKRIKIYEVAINRGQDYLEQDQPKEALKAFNYAKKQMFEDLREYQTTGVDQLLDQAHYGILIQEGDQLMQQSNYPGALASYQEAQEKVKSEDVIFKIEQVKENGYSQALTAGRQAFSQGDYEEAQRLYQTAATFKNSPELSNLLTQHSRELLLQGQQQADVADYAQAKIYFENARLFSDTPEIQERIGEIEGDMDYASAYASGEGYLRNGQIDAARESFEQARMYRNSLEVQDQLFAIEDYQKALTEGRQALGNNDTELAIAYFQNAQDIYNTPEINTWLRQTDTQANSDRLAVQSYDAQPVFASSRVMTAKGVGTSIGKGSIDFNFNTVMWMRPDCSLGWHVELYNAYGSMTATEKVDSQCSFTFSNLPDGTYTYKLKLQDDTGQMTTYSTKSNEVVVQDGEAVTVKIDAKQ